MLVLTQYDAVRTLHAFLQGHVSLFRDMSVRGNNQFYEGVQSFRDMSVFKIKQHRYCCFAKCYKSTLGFDLWHVGGPFDCAVFSVLCPTMSQRCTVTHYVLGKLSAW